MIEALVTVFGFAILSNFFTWWFEPLQSLKEKREGKLFGKILNSKVLNCPKCFGFWFTLVYLLLQETSLLYLLLVPMIVSFLAHIIAVKYYE